MEERPNFYLLLELSYDPPETSEKVISQTIKDKKLEWGKKVNHPQNGPKFREYIRLIPSIEQVMLDSESRIEEAKEALEKKKAEQIKQEKEKNKILNGYINILSAKGYVTPLEIKRMEQDTKLPQTEIMKKMVVPLQEGKQVSQVKEKDSLQPEKMKIISQLLTELAVVPKVGSVPTLYDVLEQPEKADRGILYTISQEQYRKYQNKGKGSNETENKKQVYSQAKTLFETEELYQKYNEALKKARFEMIVPYIDIAAADRVIDYSVYKQLLKEAGKEGLLQKDAKQRIAHYCQQKNILLITSNVANTEELELIQCGSCGSINKEDTNHCYHCGSPMHTSCYACHSPIHVGDTHCTKCGVMKEGKYLHDRFLKDGNLALKMYDLITAENLLLRAQYYFNGKDVENALQKLANRKNEMDSQLSRVEAEVKKRRYYSANKEWKLLENYRWTNQAQIKVLRNEITNRLSMTEAYLKQASQRTDVKESIHYYLEAINCSTDCQEALSKLNNYPPDPPTRLEANLSEEEIVLTWVKSNSEGNLAYQIIRKENSPIENRDDGEVIGEIIGNKFIDNKSLSGKIYYYSVVTKRFGALSSMATAIGPIMRMPEVEQLKAYPENGGIVLTWKNLVKTQVEVWKKEGSIPTGRGDGIKLNGVKGSGVIDNDIESDKQYGYLVICQHKDGNGRFLLSKGKSILTMGVELNPITTYISNIAGNKIELNCLDQIKSKEEIFYYVADRPFEAFKFGEVRSYSQLSNKLAHFSYKQANTDGKCVVNIVPSRVNYILPILKSGNLAIVCKAIAVKEIVDVSQLSGKKDANGSFFLQWSWPKDIEEVLVVYSEQDFPKTPMESGAVQRSCSKTAYDAFNGYKMDNINSFKELYFTIYVGEEVNGEKLYSQGVHFYHTNEKPHEIMYSIDRKGMFKKKVVLSIQCSDVGVKSPALVVVKQSGRQPLSRNDGVEVLTIDEGTDLSSLQLDISDHQEQNTFFKLFYQHEKDITRFVLDPIGDLTIGK
ncbi:zinc ribbon domain-containing protein [Niallia sp. FSL W8-1348]|uniref:zinc ribbon domain-containing protein n=1 Tax=Niallia sp. FSL W8-1348 TaxID=2954656 RepID=UPI0028FF2233|nr:zinc ribbon domain-containing protein [Niallia nealsonii]